MGVGMAFHGKKFQKLYLKEEHEENTFGSFVSENVISTQAYTEQKWSTLERYIQICIYYIQKKHF